ncbi:MAG TPA: polyprenyl synthetase family protein, partial [Patescibacteria group bacterium]
KIYPPQNIPEITSYIAEVVQKVCLGQNMDLHMNRASVSEIKCEDVLNMYDLKTSVAIEASLVPLMMLEKRSKEEIEHIKQFAHHAGLVFQIKDDILDASSTKEELGKDVEQDVDKINIVRLYGLQKAEELMNYHLAEAIKNCKDLPFNTNLFEGIVKYFAERKH